MTEQEEIDSIKNDPNLTEDQKARAIKSFKIDLASDLMVTGEFWVKQQMAEKTAKDKKDETHVQISEVLNGDMVMFFDLSAAVQRVAEICGVATDNVQVEMNSNDEGYFFTVTAYKAKSS